MSKIFNVARGTADILPADIPLWHEVESKARLVFKNANFSEIRTPAFEETELFARSMGQTSDVVQKQMLTLMSQNAQEGETSGLSLRPEGTASVVRSYIENSMDRKEPISKLFYIGPMFRGERPQKGRLRQFHQIGAEVIGPQTISPLLDAQVIAIAVDILKRCGLNGFKLKINSLGSAQDKENFSTFLRDQFKNHLSELCPDCQNRFERNVFRILDCKVQTCRAVVSNLKLGISHLSDDSQQYFQQVMHALQNMGIAFEHTPTLVRGLDYYTHTVFEISDPSLGSQDALGAGGRYNDLVTLLGGPQVDAIGFALGMERILLANATREIPAQKIDAFCVFFDDNSLAKAFALIQELRKYDVSCDMSFRLSSVKSQMRQADKNGARFVMILGDEELKEGKVALKEMATGAQTKESLDNIAQLAQLIKKGS